MQSRSSLFVPRAPAATTIPRVLIVRRRLRIQAPGALGRDLVAVGAVGGAQRANVRDGALRLDPHAQPLGEPQVVLAQRVLRPLAAADHALPAPRAAGALRPLAAEVRVVDLLAGGAEVDAHPGVLPCVAHPDLVGELPQQGVRRADPLVGRHAEHALGRVVVRRELPLPVLGEALPLTMVKEGRTGPVERVREPQAAAADAASGHDEHVLERGHPEDAAQADPRHPVVAAELPGRLGEVLVLVAAPGLDHPDRVALLGQAQRRNRAPEARADHDPVVVHPRHANGSAFALGEFLERLECGRSRSRRPPSPPHRRAPTRSRPRACKLPPLVSIRRVAPFAARKPNSGTGVHAPVGGPPGDARTRAWRT